MYRGQEPRSMSAGGQDQTKGFERDPFDESAVERKPGEEKPIATTVTRTTTTYREQPVVPPSTTSTTTRTTQTSVAEGGRRRTGWKFPISWKQALLGLALGLALSWFFASPPRTMKVHGEVKHLPPGSKSGLRVPIPLLGETLDFQLSAYKFLQDRNEKFGPVWYTNVLFRDNIALSGAEGMKKFYDKEYVRRDTGFTWNLHGPLDGKILNMMDDQTHTDRRNAALQAVADHRVIQSWLPTIEEKMEKYISKWNTKKSFQWNRELQDMMAEINAEILLGQPGSDKIIQPLASQTLKGITGVPIPSFLTNWGSARRSSQKAKDYYLSLMHERMNNKDLLNSKNDALTLMTKAFLKGAWDTEDGFATEVHHFWMASGALLANMLAGMNMHLSTNPDVLEKARQEVHRLASSGPLTLDTLNSLSYLNKIVDETRRLDPAPAAMLGRVVKGFELNGYWIPEGYAVIGDFWDTNHNANDWPNPWKFDPDRFDRGQPIGGPMAWVPHGRAHHQCPGMDLSTYIMKSLLVHLIRGDCHWKLAAKNLDWDLSQFNPEINDELKVKDFSCGNWVTKLEGVASNLKHKLFGAEKAKETAKEYAEETLESAQDKLNKAKRSAEGAAGAIKEKVAGAAETAGSKVQENLEYAEEVAQENLENLKESATEMKRNIQVKAHKAADMAQEKAEEMKDTAENAAYKLKQKASNLKESAEERASRLKGKAENLKDYAEEKAFEMKDYAEDKAREMKDYVEETASEASYEAKQKLNKAKGYAEEKASDIKESVEEGAYKLKEKAADVKDYVEDKAAEAAYQAKEKASRAKGYAEEKASDLKESVEEGAYKLKEKAAEMKDYVEDKAAEASYQAKEKAHRAKDYVEEKASDLKESAEEGAYKLKEKTVGAKDTVKEAVKEGTYKAGEAIEDTGKNIKQQAAKM